jgi:hypothetical protein
LEHLNQSAGPDQTSDRVRLELKSLLERARALEMTEKQNTRSAASLGQRKQLYQDFQTWIQTRDQWIKDKGDQYGIEFVPPAKSDESANQQAPASSPTANPGTGRIR